MRVIAGEFRSRRLQAPEGQSTRPTSDKLRETLFNVLGQQVGGARFADLYAGSGAVGIEALSRGAAFCYFAERSAPALRVLRQNLETLGLESRAAVESRGVRPMLQRLARERTNALDLVLLDLVLLDLVFLDPPFADEAEYMSTLQILGEGQGALLASEALVIAEHARQFALPATFGSLIRYRLLEQGDAALSFYSCTGR